VDDDSTDSTLGIARSYRDSRISVVQNNTNLSQVRSLNIGLRYANGEYIARIDADDTMRPVRLAVQLDFMEKHPEAALAGSWVETIDENSRPTAINKLPTRSGPVIATILVAGFVSIHSSFMYRKKAVLDVGGYNEAFSFCEDFKLIIDLLMAGRSVNNIPEVLAQYRIHGDRISTRDHRPQIERAHLAIRQFMAAFLPGVSEPERAILHDFLISAGSMKKSYWEKDSARTDMARIAELSGQMLNNISGHFKLDASQVFFMKKTFYNYMLNFAYLGNQLGNQAAGQLYRHCRGNWPYVMEKPKLFLYPVARALAAVKRP
jgi:glycosyltransferase involved in cell wall biosynthesis